MIRAIIIEDEKPAARRLLRMLEKENIKVVSVVNSVNQANQWLQKQINFDLAFMDIRLSDGLSFEILKNMNKNIPIIFTTAYDQYAIKAFKINSIDYLLKPIKQEELHFSIEKYNQLKPSYELTNIINNLVKNKKIYKERFVSKIGEFIKIIPTNNILCFYSEFKTTKIRTKQGKNIFYDESLEKIEKQLNPQKFFRVNRKYIINISGIKEIVRYSNSRLKIILENFKDAEIIVAREKVKDFQKWLQN